jgi:transcription antitermination factor NusG
MPQAPTLHWYALYTRPRAEKKLAAALQKLGIEYYLPLLRQRKKWSDRYKWVEEPVFASYIFVHLDFRKDALRVLQLPQAVYFVSREGAPTVIEEDDLTLLRIAVENFAESLSIRDTSTLAAGEKVRIIDGPFAGKEAVIERIHGKTLVVVAFPALNQSVQVEIPVAHLTRAGS